MKQEIISVAEARERLRSAQIDKMSWADAVEDLSAWGSLLNSAIEDINIQIQLSENEQCCIEDAMAGKDYVIRSMGILSKAHSEIINNLKSWIDAEQK